MRLCVSVPSIEVKYGGVSLIAKERICHRTLLTDFNCAQGKTIDTESKGTKDHLINGKMVINNWK